MQDWKTSQLAAVSVGFENIDLNFIHLLQRVALHYILKGFEIIFSTIFLEDGMTDIHEQGYDENTWY